MVRILADGFLLHLFIMIVIFTISLNNLIYKPSLSLLKDGVYNLWPTTRLLFFPMFVISPDVISQLIGARSRLRMLGGYLRILIVLALKRFFRDIFKRILWS